MSHYYAAVSALIFAIVAIAHLIRISKGWAAHIGPYTVPMSLSWIGLLIAGLLAIWGVMQLS